MQGSKEADKAGHKALVVQLFMEQANALDFKEWYNQLSQSAAAGTLQLPCTITEAYNLMCTELLQQGKNVNQARLALVHTAVTQLAQMSSGGSGNSGGSNNGGSR